MEIYQITYHFGRGIPIIRENRGDSKGKSRQTRLAAVTKVVQAKAEKLHATSFTIETGRR